MDDPTVPVDIPPAAAAADDDVTLDPPECRTLVDPRATLAPPRQRAPLLGDTIHDPGARAELAPGDTVASDFVVLRRLARGDGGTVYAVEQRSAGRLRTMRALHHARARTADARDAFLREAMRTTRLASRHVPEVIAAGVDAAHDLHYLVTEALEGETLADRLSSLGAGVPMPAAEARAVLASLCEAVASAHARGVVHRDLKPANVLLARGDEVRVVLLDWSVAHEPGARDDTPFVGTPLWMAPEQATGEAITPGTDVWAVGILAFRMFTGRSYWRCARAAVIEASAFAQELLESELPAARARAAETGSAAALPPGFDVWFARCVARDPAQRFRDGAAMLSSLPDLDRPPVRRSSSASVPPVQPVDAQVTARRPTMPPPRPATRSHLDDPLSFLSHEETTRVAPRPSRSRPLWLVVAGAAGAFTLVALGLVATPRRDPGAPPAQRVTQPAQPAPPAAPDDRLVWTGEASGDDGAWSFVLSLRPVGEGRVRGWFAWTSQRGGEQVREALEGTARDGAYELRGVTSSAPQVLPVNAWRITAMPRGALRGASVDGRVTVQGAAR